MTPSVDLHTYKRKRSPEVSPPPTARPSKLATTQPNQSLPTAASLAFPHGAVRKTWAFGHDRTPWDIKIEEVLEKRTLRTAVLSAFQWDTAWLFPKLDLPRTNLILVIQAKTEADQQTRRDEIRGAENYIQLCFPSMAGQINCMHSKLMLLFHPHKLRLVVPSANLMPYDWGETGHMENAAFIIDVPRRADTANQPPTTTPFAEELAHFVKLQGIDERVRQSLHTFDWSATARMAFVHTAGGAWYGSDMQRTGLTGLSNAIRSLGLFSDQSLQVDFAASSIGSLNEDYLHRIHSAARGHLRIGNQSTSVPLTPNHDLSKCLRIIFPSNETVTNSTGGPDCAGTICLPRKYWLLPHFPKSFFRDYKSTRSGLLSHNKILFARGVSQPDPAEVTRPFAWIYIGSANMSESAWGKIVYDKVRKGIKINCRNWECGVVLPVDFEDRNKATEMPGKLDEDADTASTVSEPDSKIPDMDVFDRLFPSPFEYPGQAYSGRRPWCFY